jgi:hypothetical protein
MKVMELALTLAGVGQITLAVTSTTFARLLDWDHDVAKMRPLVQRFFWIYTAYILACNLAFGLLSAFGARWLADGTPLAAAVSGFIAVYWTARLVLQFAVVRRGDMPVGPWYRVGEVALVSLFVYLSAVYAWACATNLAG